MFLFFFIFASTNAACPHSSIVIPSLISPTLSSFHSCHSALGYDIFCKYCFISLLCMLSRFSCVHLFATLWTLVCQTPLFMGFPRQEYWSGLLFPSSGDFPDPGIKPRSPALWADALLSEPPRNTSHLQRFSLALLRAYTGA